MSQDTTSIKQLPEAKPEEEKKPFSFFKFILYVSIPPIIIIVVLFVGGLILALTTDPSQTAPRIGMIRDIFIIILAFEFILVVLALVALILQVAKLIATVDDEIKPIVETTKETLETVKETAQFVGKNVTSPVISAQAFFAGLFAFIRDIGGIRRAIRRTKPKSPKGNNNGK
ncbi:MAG: hypothetical protein CUN52_01475 [Phototrophicales bacterium]|nr:MAG: hypothetical protein CUN52_01475 [Phototrophicales bacterium]